MKIILFIALAGQGDKKT